MYLRSFIDACEGFGWNGGPEFKTRLRVLMNGRERRNADWSQAKHRYTLPFLNLRADSYRAVRQMFEVCMGMLNAFLYQDPLDNQATNEVFATGDGVQTSFQLTKFSQIDGVTYQRMIFALYVPGNDGDAVNSTVTVTVNGTPTAVTVDYDRGMVSFAAPPSNGTILRWSGSFAIWVRFNQDWLPMSIDNKGDGDFFRNGAIELIEVAEPEVTS